MLMNVTQTRARTTEDVWMAPVAISVSVQRGLLAPTVKPTLMSARQVLVFMAGN